MDVIFEFIAELIVQVIVEVLVELGRAGLATVLARPWVRLLVMMVVGVAAGFAWTSIVRPDTRPLLVTALVAAQWLLAVVVSEPKVAGIQLTRTRLLSFAAVGTAYAAGRWLGLA